MRACQGAAASTTCALGAPEAGPGPRSTPAPPVSPAVHAFVEAPLQVCHAPSREVGHGRSAAHIAETQGVFEEEAVYGIVLVYVY